MAKALLLVLAAWTGASPGDPGAIVGKVINASSGRTPVAGAEVVLRIQLDGRFVPLEETKADAAGRFAFRNLAVGPQYWYLPGASRGGVHYPGPRIQLAPRQPRAELELCVHDAISAPSPLVIASQQIAIRPAPGALFVTEVMVVENPSSKAYVGLTAEEGNEPVTLQLAIPPDFDRTTFEKEFFGRRFSLFNGRLVTGIPWPPGRMELKFTYVLPNRQRVCRWERPLDLPCASVRVSVETGDPQDVSSNLERGSDQRPGEVAFASTGTSLPAGHVPRVEIGRLPVPWIAYGRWMAMALLGVLTAGGALVTRRRSRPAAHKDAPSLRRN
jgi:hypothetical protein